MEFTLALVGVVVGLVAGGFLTSVWLRQTHAARSASLATERDLLRERVVDLEAAVSEDAQTAALLSPLRDALGRVERQVTTLERDRVEQYGELATRLGEVTTSTSSLQRETATLAGALSASTTRGQWGELQLRRVLEHAGMLAHCDFDEQVTASTASGARIRPDVVVRLPGDRVLVIDSKAPLTAFLQAEADDLEPQRRQVLREQHSRALRGHIDGLAAKDYWSAFANTPEMVVCFVPGDAILAAALNADPSLMDRALAKRVVPASPSTLMALLRSVALAWQHDSLAANARELLDLGRELHGRLATLGGHTTALGAQLAKSVESYNAMVGSLESRVLVTARKLGELGIDDRPLPQVSPIEQLPRSLSAPELLDAVAEDQTRPQLDLGLVDGAAYDRMGDDERRRHAG